MNKIWRHLWYFQLLWMRSGRFLNLPHLPLGSGGAWDELLLQPPPLSFLFDLFLLAFYASFMRHLQWDCSFPGLRSTPSLPVWILWSVQWSGGQFLCNFANNMGQKQSQHWWIWFSHSAQPSPCTPTFLSGSVFWRSLCAAYCPTRWVADLNSLLMAEDRSRPENGCDGLDCVPVVIPAGTVWSTLSNSNPIEHLKAGCFTDIKQHHSVQPTGAVLQLQYFIES